MAYIRFSTYVGKHKKRSAVYAWADVSGLVWITVDGRRPSRAKNAAQHGLHGVALTHAEMTYMCKDYLATERKR